MTAGDLITEQWQIEFRGIVWGGANADVQITDMSGWWDKPALRGSNTDRAGRHGQVAGRKYAEGRVVEVELSAMVDDDDMSILRAIDDVCAYQDSPVEEDLVIWAKSEYPLLVRGRLEKAAIPTDHEWSVGHHRIRLQWVCADPRKYVWWATVSPVLGMPGGATTGITFPVTFPVTFGSGTSSGSLTLWNAGNATAWPVFTLTGALSAPTITRVDTGQRLQFDPAFVLADGETMTIDTDSRSVTIAGVSRRDALVLADWFGLPPGRSTVVELTSTGAYDSSAGLTVHHRATYL